MGVRVRMWMWSLTLFYLLLAAPQAQSDGGQTTDQEECRTAECPEVSNPPAAHRDAAGRAETSSEPGLPTWPPSQDCRRCSRTRYRSANEEKCKNCPEPEGKLTKGEKN